MSIAPAPPSVHRPTHLDPVDAAGIITGVFALVVRVDDEHYRRRIFLSLSSAQHAAERARARGQGAEVVLVQLVPVAGWSAREAVAMAEQVAA